MPTTERTHRASAQRRRAALLAAAADLSAEVGAGAVTHRAVAARAGVPLSTTSYFFSSIDELVTEALRHSAQARVDDFDAAEAAGVLGGDETPMAEVVDGVVDRMLDTSRTIEGSQVEFYLAAGRQPELQPDASAMVNRFAERVEEHLSRSGAQHPADAAWAIQALADGAMLHRLAEIDTDHRTHLAAGIRALLAAAMLTEDELTELLSRYDS
jgi:DNA-binding transcriptional regulator YbjK